MRSKTTMFRKRDGKVLNSEDIYSEPSTGSIISPFSFTIDPMEHLILVNFEKDPDEYYNTFEFQKACDKNGEKRLLAIAYRTDGATDIYYQPGFPFGSQDSVLNGASFFERPLEGAKFEVTADNIEVYFVFEDKMGREIKVSVKESKGRNKKPFFLLAPIGANSKKPMSLPVYSLYEMSFARQKYSDLEIVIDKVKHKPDTFPMPIDCAKNYFTRYSEDTFNVDWNKNFKGSLAPLFPDVNCRREFMGTTYELEENAGHYEIKKMSTGNKKHRITIEFYPAIPDVVCLSNETDLDGSFSITTDNTPGTICGNYNIKRYGNDIDFKINPTNGWEPNESRWILKILFFVVKIFKEWPKSYVWNARITLDDTGQPMMQSAWKRI